MNLYCVKQIRKLIFMFIVLTATLKGFEKLLINKNNVICRKGQTITIATFSYFLNLEKLQELNAEVWQRQIKQN